MFGNIEASVVQRGQVAFSIIVLSIPSTNHIRVRSIAIHLIPCVDDIRFYLHLPSKLPVLMSASTVAVPMASPNALKRTYAEAGFREGSPAPAPSNNSSVLTAIPSGSSTTHDLPSQVPTISPPSAITNGLPHNTLTEVPDGPMAATDASVASLPQPVKKPKMTFQEKEMKRVEKEIKDRERAVEKARKEAEKVLKDEEKASKEMERIKREAEKEGEKVRREEDKKVKDAEKEERRLAKMVSARIRQEEKARKEAEKLAKEEEMAKKASVCIP